MRYEDYMQKYVLNPAGCYDMHIAGTYYKDRRPNETKYYMHQGSIPVYEYNNSGRMVEKCYGDTDIPRLAGAGAWCGSAAELSRLIASIDGMPHVKDILSKKSVDFMTRGTARPPILHRLELHTKERTSPDPNRITCRNLCPDSEIRRRTMLDSHHQHIDMEGPWLLQRLDGFL